MNNDKALMLSSLKRIFYFLLSIPVLIASLAVDKHTTIRYVLLSDFVMITNVLFSFFQILSENDSEDIECWCEIAKQKKDSTISF